MKKVLSIVAALLLCVGTQAQIVSSRSSIVRTEKQQSNKQWFLRGGLNVMKMTGDDDESGSKLGYNFIYGFQKPMGSIGTYWGMEFGLGSRGWGYSEDDYEHTTYKFLRLHSDISTTSQIILHWTHISEPM